MKFVLVGPVHPYRGGISHYNTRLTQALKEKGHKTSVVNFKRMYPGLLFPGQTQYDESADAFKVRSERILDSINPINWYSVARRIKALKSDAVIFNWWQPFFGPCYRVISGALGDAGGTRIMICHNVRPHEQSGIDGFLSAMAFSKFDRFIVHSEQDKDNLLDIKPDAVVAKNPHPVYDNILPMNAGDL